MDYFENIQSEIQELIFDQCKNFYAMDILLSEICDTYYFSTALILDDVRRYIAKFIKRNGFNKI